MCLPDLRKLQASAEGLVADRVQGLRVAPRLGEQLLGLGQLQLPPEHVGKRRARLGMGIGSRCDTRHDGQGFPRVAFRQNQIARRLTKGDEVRVEGGAAMRCTIGIEHAKALQSAFQSRHSARSPQAFVDHATQHLRIRGIQAVRRDPRGKRLGFRQPRFGLRMIVLAKRVQCQG